MGPTTDLRLRTRLVGPVDAWLSELGPRKAAALISSVMLSVMVLDLTGSSHDLAVAVLYIVPSSIACWRFGHRIGYLVTGFALALAIGKYLLVNDRTIDSVIVSNAAAFAFAVFFNTRIVVASRNLNHAIHEFAMRDPLTGVLNKAAFTASLEARFSPLVHRRPPMLLAFVDLDGFKDVNDQHGHHAGDKALISFAQFAGAGLGPDDALGRLGGDEFGTVRSLSEAADGETMALLLHSHFCDSLRCTGFDLTCSMGALIVPSGFSGCPFSLLQQADALMYQVKRKGKNAVLVSTAAQHEGASNHEQGERAFSL